TAARLHGCTAATVTVSQALSHATPTAIAKPLIDKASRAGIEFAYSHSIPHDDGIQTMRPSQQ
ncbi:MAG: hypothetical protein WCY32_13070, partial [Burkholderiaceae bacterium]